MRKLIFQMHASFYLRIVVILLLSSIAFKASAQPPNDHCNGAEEIQADDTTFHFVSGNVFLASQDDNIEKCTTEPEHNKDIWYKFVAANDTQEIGAAACLTCFTVDLDFVLYTGSCDNLELFDCATQSTSFLGEYKTYIDLIPGTTYYIKVFDDNEGNLNMFDLDVGVKIPTTYVDSTDTNDNPPTAIDDLENNNEKFIVYPNPANNNIYIKSSQINTNGTIVIADVTGKEIYRLYATANNTQIDISNFSAGVYHVVYYDDEHVYRKKFIKY